jgi:predicted metalloprotease with PDZ domain
MRRLPLALAALALLLPAAAWAKQPKCPLPLDSCIVQFGHMRERPWFGLEITRDSLGNRNVTRVLAGSPAEKAGVRVGDVLETLDGMQPPVFYAGRAGWKDGQHISVGVRRGNRERTLALAAAHIPEDLFARIVGEHMLEGHLAYMVAPEPDERH